MLVYRGQRDIHPGVRCSPSGAVELHRQCPGLKQDETACRIDLDSGGIRRSIYEDLVGRKLRNGE